jgi:hypothetical protein
MVRTLAPILCFLLALAAGPAAAQTAPSKPAPEQPAPPPRAEPPGQPINVRVELAITDQFHDGEPLKKTVTMLAADRARSSIRNESRGVLNVDAHPSVLQSGAIRLTLALEYMPLIPASGSETARTLSRVNEHVTVVLDSGKPLVISQAADPTSDRKVLVQVTATIVK